MASAWDLEAAENAVLKSSWVATVRVSWCTAMDLAPALRASSWYDGVGIPNHRDSGELGIDVPEEFQPFPAEAGLVEKCSRHVSPRPGEARDKPRGHRVALEIDRHDGRVGAGALRDLEHVRPDDDEGSDAKPEQVCKVAGQLFTSSVRVALIDHQVLPFDVAELSQALQKCPQRMGEHSRSEAEDPDMNETVVRTGRLRPDNSRRGEGTGERGHQEVAAIHYSITLSARASSDRGIARLSALAAGQREGLAAWSLDPNPRRTRFSAEPQNATYGSNVMPWPKRSGSSRGVAHVPPRYAFWMSGFSRSSAAVPVRTTSPIWST